MLPNQATSIAPTAPCTATTAPVVTGFTYSHPGYFGLGGVPKGVKTSVDDCAATCLSTVGCRAFHFGGGGGVTDGETEDCVVYTAAFGGAPLHSCSVAYTADDVYYVHEYPGVSCDYPDTDADTATCWGCEPQNFKHVRPCFRYFGNFTFQCHYQSVQQKRLPFWITT